MSDATTVDIPPIISVDDHVVEPPDLFIRWLPAKFRGEAPHIERLPWEFSVEGRHWPFRPATSGPETDFWAFEDLRVVICGATACAGVPVAERTNDPVSFEDMRPGYYSVAERLADMDVNGVERSLCFPTFPRFCGQTFLEAHDKDLAMACVLAYNDWMVEEWCGDSGGRLIPLCLIPLWDPVAAAAEIRRNAARGVRAVAFSEMPSDLGLPSIHDAGGHWDPVFDACDETGTVMCMHTGSSSRFTTTSPDAPYSVMLALTTVNSQKAMADWLLSGVLARFPRLKIAFSESQIGWMPFMLERADSIFRKGAGTTHLHPAITEPPSSYVPGRVYGCFFEDDFGVEARHAIGVDQITFETDYPHQDTTWPDSVAYAQQALAGLDAAEIHKIVRGNAIAMLDLPEVIEGSPAAGSPSRWGDGARGLHAWRYTRVNVGRAIDPAVEGAPGRVALVIGQRHCTYGELEQWVRRVAATLVRAGVGPRDRVALVDDGSVLSVATILAAARIGAAAAQMNVQLTPGELRALAELVGARAGVAGDRFAAGLAEALGGAVLTEDDVRGADPSPGAGMTVGDGEDIALVLFTSGTTGLPKPVTISHAVVSQRLRYYAPPFDASEPQGVDMLSSPVFHIAGTLGLLITLHAGRKLVILPRFDAGEWLRSVEAHGVTQTFVVPTMLQRILDHPDFATRDLASLRRISYGAAAAPVALVERALEALPHVEFTNAFGQTETLGAYAALTPDDHRARRHLGSAGRALPGVEVRIVDPVTGEDRPRREAGEVWVRAAQNVTTGWFRTGDIASMDEDGYLFPVGRLSDTINRAGEKFGPIEVEEVIRAHPSVRDVGVAGVPDTEMGEEVGAVVVADGGLGADELRAFCAARLARYKVPRWVVFADDLPYNNIGKVSRPALAEVILAARRQAESAGGHRSHGSRAGEPDARPGPEATRPG